MTPPTCYVTFKDKKIGKNRRFFGEKLVFGGAGKDFFGWKNRLQKNRKKIGKNRRFFDEKSEKSDIFPKKADFSLNLG